MENIASNQKNMFRLVSEYLNIYEDKQCIVFEKKYGPQDSVHFLVMPKKAISNITTSVDDERVLGHLLLIAKRIAIEKGLQNTGYHVMVDEDIGSSTFKGLHVFGRPWHKTIWPIVPESRL